MYIVCIVSLLSEGNESLFTPNQITERLLTPKARRVGTLVLLLILLVLVLLVEILFEVYIMFYEELMLA